MSRFQTVIKHARFVYSPYTATEMQGFAQVLTDSIRARIQSGRNIYDQAAPLKPGPSGRRGYPEYKAARGLQPIRDWTWSGHTLRCLKVLHPLPRIAWQSGFLTRLFQTGDKRRRRSPAFNNRREAQWGVSPRDRQAVLAAFQARPFVMLKAA
jgi:hypothetical protein